LESVHCNTPWVEMTKIIQMSIKTVKDSRLNRGGGKKIRPMPLSKSLEKEKEIEDDILENSINKAFDVLNTDDADI